MSLSIAVWLLPFGLMYSATNEMAALFWGKSGFYGVSILTVLSYHITVKVFHVIKQRKFVLLIAWLISIIFALLIPNTNVFMDGVSEYWWGHYPRFTPYGYLFVAFFVGMMSMIVLEYLLHYKKRAKGEIKKRLLYFFIPYVAVIDFLPLFGIAVFPFGFLAIFTYAVLTGRAILRYHWVDITPAYASKFILGIIPDMIIVCDQRYKIELVNKSACKALGYKKKELINQSVYILLHDKTNKRDGFKRILEQEYSENDEIVFSTKWGDKIYVSLSTARLRRSGQSFSVGIVIAARNIEERRNFEKKLKYMATHDYLTGLHNRSYFEERLEEMLQESKRYHKNFAVLWIDIDDFKEINDTYGHDIGDKALGQISNLLSTRLRTTDIKARLGGDEFAVLMPNIGHAEIKKVLNSLLELIAISGIETNTGKVYATYSIGVVFSSQEMVTLVDVLKSADIAMYHAKKSGKNKYVIYTPSLIEEQTNIYPLRVAWKDRLRHALVNDQFKLYMQPILDTRTKDVMEFECLLRLCSDGKEISPIKFLDIAKEYDMINDINRWVVERTIVMLKALYPINSAVKLSCNLTSGALQDYKILTMLTSEHKANNLLSRLTFEITESDAIINFSAATKFIETCKQYGCTFSLDDFGVGFSSLSHLKFLPVDYIKIDGSFIKNIDTDPINEALVKAIIESAKIMNLKTIAEYVSSKEIYDKMIALEIDYCQGFYFGVPLAFDEAVYHYLTRPRWIHHY